MNDGLTELWRRLTALLRRNQIDADLEEEMRLHVELRAQEQAKAGLASDEARHAAQRQFGNALLLKEAGWEMWGWRWLETLLQDLRYGLRTLGRAPGFTAVAILSLALGIGANSAIFSLVDFILLRPLPYPHSDHLFSVGLSVPQFGATHGVMSMADFLDVRAKSRAFVDLAAYVPNRFNLTGKGPAEQIQGAWVSAGFFSTLEAQPQVGRFFIPGDSAPGGSLLAVLSDNLRRQRFGANPAAVGQSIRLNGRTMTIVGITPRGLDLPQNDVQVWASLTLAPPERRGPYFLRSIARLRPGFTLAQMRADLFRTSQQVQGEDPMVNGPGRISFTALPLREYSVGNVRQALLVVCGAVILVLLIASANVTNLLLARAATREREMAIRLTVGASRWLVLRQLLTESLVLAVWGGTVGLLLTWGGIRVVRLLGAGTLPRLDEVVIDGRILAFTLGASVLTGLVFGVVPAFQSARAGLSEGLNSTGRQGTENRKKHNWRSVLVTTEIAMASLLLIGAGLLLKSFVLLETSDWTCPQF